jgi:hypothetical protein
LVVRKIANPTNPDIIEATSMASFAVVCVCKSLKESSAIKIDMVNPIPAKNPTPIICLALQCVGIVDHPSRIAI